MEGGRFFAHALPIALPACVALFATFTPRATRFPYFALCAALVISGTQFAARKSKSLTSWSAPAVSFSAPSLSHPYSERQNKVHQRDIPIIEVLRAVVPALDEKHGRPITILTGQGGMVPFYLGLEHYGRFKVIDRFGLLDRRLSKSERVRSFGHGRLGLRVSWDALLEHWDEILEQAELDEPDIVFDVSFSGKTRKRLMERGYVVRYRQLGIVLSDSELLPGHDQPGSAFVWIKKEDAAAIPREVMRNFELSPDPWSQ